MHVKLLSSRVKWFVCLCLGLGFASLAGCGSGADEAETADDGMARRGLPSKPDPRKETEMSVTKASYGTTQDGQEVDEYTCQNKNGMVMKMITYGATMTALEVSDREGNYDNVTLGYDSLEGYENGSAYFGATVGRYCNRIANGKFTIDGTEYTLATNNGPHHLHGGNVGFSKVVWDAEPIETEDEVGVKFTYLSKDGEEGYPGNLQVTARYTINNNDALTISFEATTDKATHVSLTNHNYWNLGGAGSGTILDHVAQLQTPLYLEVDETLIPTGELAMVQDTPLDFQALKPIGQDIQDMQVGDGPVGYDHCLVIPPSQRPASVGAVKDPESGREMQVATTLDGVQFYTGNFLDGSESVGGFEQHSGFCLETQHFPDSPNKSDKQGFTNSLLKPGETFRATTIYSFVIRQ